MRLRHGAIPRRDRRVTSADLRPHHWRALTCTSSGRRFARNLQLGFRGRHQAQSACLARPSGPIEANINKSRLQVRHHAFNLGKIDAAVQPVSGVSLFLPHRGGLKSDKPAVFNLSNPCGGVAHADQNLTAIIFSTFVIVK